MLGLANCYLSTIGIICIIAFYARLQLKNKCKFNILTFYAICDILLFIKGYNMAKHGIDIVTTFPAVLGAVLVKLRTEKGMKQGDLAAAIGLGASTWSRIERGSSGLSIDQLRHVAKVFDITPGLILEMVEASEEEIKGRGIRIEPSWEIAFSTSTVKAVIHLGDHTMAGFIEGAITNFRANQKKEAKNKSVLHDQSLS